jgi:hypothetical protein
MLRHRRICGSRREPVDTRRSQPVAYTLVKEFTRFRVQEPIPDRASHALNGTLTRLDRIHIFAGLLALGLTFFLAVEPTENLILLLMCALTALGTDNIVRSHPRASFHRLDDTALYLFVPVLFTLGAGLFLEEVASGHWTLAAGLLCVVPYWFILRAEYDSVDRASPNYHYHRLILNGATYIVAFLFFATMFDFDLDLLTTAFAAGIVSLLLAIEVLREEALDTVRTLTYALAIGVLLAEAAWVTHFLPLDGSGAAVFLLLAFYLMTGLMHNYLADRLSLRTGGEFGAVALCGLATVVVFDVFL